MPGQPASDPSPLEPEDTWCGPHLLQGHRMNFVRERKPLDAGWSWTSHRPQPALALTPLTSLTRQTPVSPAPCFKLDSLQSPFTSPVPICLPPCAQELTECTMPPRCVLSREKWPPQAARVHPQTVRHPPVPASPRVCSAGYSLLTPPPFQGPVSCPSVADDPLTSSDASTSQNQRKDMQSSQHGSKPLLQAARSASPLPASAAKEVQARALPASDTS